MVPSFATFCSDAPIGEIGFVHTQFGYHIVQVNERRGTKFLRLAVVSVPIELSNDSYTTAQNRLQQFRTSYQAKSTQQTDSSITERIDAVLKKDDFHVLNLKIQDNSPRIYSGLETQSAKDEVFKFAYSINVHEDAISSILEDRLGCFVCILSSIYKKGVPYFEYVRARMMSDLAKTKRSQILQEQMSRDARTSTKMHRVQLSLSNPQLELAGFEPSVIGNSILNYNENTEEKIIAGKSGVFYIEIVKELPQDQPIDRKELREKMSDAQRSYLQQSFNPFLIQTNKAIDKKILNN